MQYRIEGGSLPAVIIQTYNGKSPMPSPFESWKLRG